MMYDRRRDIRNRIRKRKRMQESKGRLSQHDRYPASVSNVITYDASEEVVHPLFRKEVFMLKVLISAILFIAVAVIFRHPSDKFQATRDFVAATLQTELQFAAVTDWYEETFGKPIAFLPSDQEKGHKDAEQVTAEYSVPVAGKVIQPFENNGEGVLLKTDKDLKAGSVQEGVVIFAGKKEKFGNTVVIQHRDGSESWYGKLKSIEVKVYDSVGMGDKIGTVSNLNTANGVLFFAMKQNDTFIDPNQVMAFD